ncbi:MAG: hypothetical protein RJA81_314 [Planctomycetota bacterium]
MEVIYVSKSLSGSILLKPQNGDAPSYWVAVGLFKKESDTRKYLESEPSFQFINDLLPPESDAPTAPGETLMVYSSKDQSRPNILFYGLGDYEKQNPRAMFDAAVAASKKLASKADRKVQVLVPSGNEADIAYLIRVWIGVTQGPGLLKKEATRFEFQVLEFVDVSGQSNETDVMRAVATGNGVNLARELGNMTPNDKNPVILAERAKQEGEAVGCEVEIWDESRIRVERFGGLLGVAAGSARPPRFVILRYFGAGKDKPHFALVGKGVTFDSGGLSLKPSNSMEDMKSDMTGSAVVLAVITRLSQLKIPVNVIAYMPLTENMTGGLATKLGDVLKMRDGTTVEILNTDAEGRLILADALAYAVEQKPVAVVDLATLTGACMIALGNRIAGIFSNTDTLVEEIQTAAQTSGERVWQLPIDEDFKDQLKSNVADLKNVGTRGGGAITAAKFLQHFVGETPWVHLDIAGPSWSDSDSATRDAGGTGCYVATLVEWLRSKSAL